jgi:type I restriction enzyme R subunit
MLLAMATGTGKTFMTVNEVYRLMKSGVAKRILFLVDAPCDIHLFIPAY